MNTKKSFFIVLSIATLQLNAADHKLVEKKEENPFLLASFGSLKQLEQHPRVVALREQGDPKPIHTLFEEEFSKRRGVAGFLRKVKDYISRELNDNPFEEYEFKAEAFCNIVTEGNIPLMKLFLQKGVHPDSYEDMMCNRSALSLAIDEGNVEAIKLLLQHKANPNMTVMHGSPLMCAMCIESEEQREEVLRLLIGSGAQVDLVVDGYTTALASAASSGDIQGVKLLLGLGAHNRIAYKLSESGKREEKGRQERESARLLRIKSVLEEALVEEKDEKHANINEKIQLVIDYLKKDIDGHDADSCKESIARCAIDRVHEKLNRHEFVLTNKEKDAFIAVNVYLSQEWERPALEHGGIPVDREKTPEEEQMLQMFHDAHSVSEYIDGLLARDEFRLKPDEKEKLEAVKKYLEEKTKDQEMLVVNQEDNEKISRL